MTTYHIRLIKTSFANSTGLDGSGRLFINSLGQLLTTGNLFKSHSDINKPLWMIPSTTVIPNRTSGTTVQSITPSSGVYLLATQFTTNFPSLNTGGKGWGAFGWWAYLDEGSLDFTYPTFRSQLCTYWNANKTWDWKGDVNLVMFAIHFDFAPTVYYHASVFYEGNDPGADYTKVI